jgi:hypothetical protein
MKKIAHHYFAYGANMNLAQMKQRCSSPKVLGIARLPGYKVGFYGYSAIWDGAQETVIPDWRSEVWGVVYKLQFFDCEQLDVYQDVRFDGTGPYFHYPIMVEIQQATLGALMYKKNILREAQLPSTEYLNFIVQGATEQGLPEGYITLLQNTQTKPASYDVPIARKSKLSYISAMCGDCGQ